MLRLAVDQDFNEKVLRGVGRRIPDLDAVRVLDVGLSTAKDPEILAWAADEGRIVLSHDRKTMMRHAYERMASGLPVPGVIIVRQTLAIREAIEEVCLVVEAAGPEDLEGRVLVLPL